MMLPSVHNQNNDFHNGVTGTTLYAFIKFNNFLVPATFFHQLLLYSFSLISSILIREGNFESLVALLG